MALRLRRVNQNDVQIQSGTNPVGGTLCADSLWTKRVVERVSTAIAVEAGIPDARRLHRARLPRRFYDRDAALVAQELLDLWLVHVIDGEARIGRIVETEAYLGPHDLAAHSARGLTPRTRVMFGPPGHAYVYLIYGMHHCVNVVTGAEGHAAAVLLRAVEPVANLSGRTQGPGLLCRAFGIDRRMNGQDLLSSGLFIARPRASVPFTIARRPRIGVDYAGAWARRLLRFYISNNTFISRP